MTSTDIENERVFLSPSKLDSWETNQLVWFIDSIVASETSPASGLGTLLHSAMEKIAPAGVSTGEVSATEIVEQLEIRWSELETTFEAPWQSDVERRRARALSEALAQYLSDFDRLGGRLLSGEGAFVLILDDENSPEPVRVTVRGKIDRVEQRHDGAVVIADLKTGKSKVAVKDLPQNGQLTCYQLAVDVGALPDVPAEATSGGAKLIFIAESTARKLYTERPQNPGNSEFFETARERIRSAARGMSGKSFIGRLFESEERGEFASRYEYRIHLVTAVTR